MPEEKSGSAKKSEESGPPMGYPVYPGYPPPPPGYPPQHPGYPPPPPAPYYYPPPPVYGSTSFDKMGLVAGIMLVIGGLIALLYGIYYFFLITFLGSLSGGLFFSAGGGWLYICSAIPLVAGIVGLVGGVFAIQRKNWAIVLVGSILIIVSPGLIFGVLGLIFAILGKEEFES